jgi:SAM-dependent methyltransferase
MTRTDDYTGLAAVAWELFSGTDTGRDYAFLERVLKENPGRTLEVGCGTGRLLLHFLRAGYEVEGVEPSFDMRTILQRNAVGLGLEPVVYDQSMQELDLPHRYRTILIPCGSFQLVIDHGEAFEALRRFHAHLEPGGILVLTLYNMLSILGVTLDGSGEWGLRACQLLPDGTEMQKHARLDSLSKLDQTLASTLRYRRLRGEEVVEEEFCNGDMRWYVMHELSMMLKHVGFGNVRVTGNYTDAAPTDGDEVLSFVAST